MARINLLPWRDEVRRKKREDLIARILLCMFLSAVVMGIVHLHMDRLIDIQVRRNDFLQSEIRTLDEKIKEIQSLDVKKRNLLARMEIIQQLQTSRPEMVHLFDEIARRVPDGVALIDLGQTDRRLVINGVAQSNSRVSGFLHNLESSPWFSKPVLKVIQVGSERDLKRSAGLNFTLQVEQAAQAVADREPES
ncbi:MAG: PilN domain-containing protein [Methylotetracoccus sp.]|jgi:type IV pilus assembly protein PilN|nr:PilN domain-containing protein [Methylotetracoccus sp.]